MTIRNLNSTLKTSLMNYDPFIVAHLIKFERPQKVSQFGGKVEGSALDFTYITDAQHDILFDDGSKDNSGTALGIQNYRANKVQSLGTINENIQAKASNMSLVLDSSSLGASAQSTVTFTTTEMSGDVDLVEKGFQEGDKIKLVGTGSNNNKYVIINSFKNDGKTIVFTAVDTISSDSNPKVFTVSLASEELLSMLSDKNSSSYTNYINRQVLIYKVHINPETRAIIGDPYLHFKGITNGVSIDERIDSSKITWTLSSHWGDFIRVQGRLTDDATHRALQIDGSPDLNSVVKSDYATDLGFMHANTAVNHLATYMTTEIEYKQVDINGGWPGGKRLREIEIEVPRQTDLQFNLQAKMLPVVYGVRKIDSFPIFVDTHKDRSSEVYKVDAICEGKIAGILDIFIEDNPTICLDLPDFDTRSPQGTQYDADTVEIQCNGRADRGDTLTQYSNYGSLNSYFNYDYLATVDWEALAALNPHYDYSAIRDIDWSSLSTGSTNAQTGDATGILHKGSHSVTSPLKADFTFYQGLEDQQSDNTLTSLASSKQFKVQNAYYSGNAPYWSPNHRLLDTAYVVGKYTIAEGETSIPSLKYVVRGRDPECYNYDGSYKHDYQSGTSESHSNFALGSSVTLHKTSNDVQIGSAVDIIDKWSTFDSDGVRDHRFRFSTTPTLTDGSGAITAFYMKNSSNEKWHMQTWDHTEITGTVSTELKTTVFSEALGTLSGLKLTFTGSSTVFRAALGHPKAEIGVTKASLPTLSASTFAGFTYNSSTNVIDNFSQMNTVQNFGSVQIKNAIILGSGASSVDNFYNGNIITVTNNSGSTPYTQERTIIDYDGSTKVATVNASWDWQYIPSSGDAYAIGSIGDRRVTLNPSMQLLDYMTNKRYGKGLEISSDIDLPAWKEAAIACDTRSDVTIAVATSVTIAEDEVYRYPATGNPHFMGTVKSVETLGGKKQVVFKDVVGKLGTKWNSWKIFQSGELYWHNGKAYAGTGTLVAIAPTSNHLATLELTKVGGSTISVDLSEASANGNPIVKKYSTVSGSYTASGYSLYDADDVKYWRYVGWDDSSQRNVTRHQMNQVVDTKLPLFDNINKILSQFNGMLKYTAGKYSLQIKGKKGVLDAAEQITQADIIGTIKVSDKGLKNSKNYVSTSIIDPANKFEGRSVSFFNSDYLKEDKGIQKKGQFSLPGITNYFNARFNIKQYLDESRYGLTIQFTLAPRGLLLTAGSIIELTYPRFGYTSKEFRITNLNVKKDGTVDIVADEHNDAAYAVPESSGTGYGLVEQPESGQVPESLPTPAPPTNLQCSQTSQGEIVLTWTNPSTFTSATHKIEIYSSTINNFDNTQDPVSLIGTSDTNSFHDIIGLGEGNQTRYYWIRCMVRTPKLNISGTDFRNVPSLYEPARPSSGTFVGVQGVGQATRAVRSIKLNPGATTTFVYENDGTGIESGSHTYTDITTTKFNDAGTVTYQWKINGSNVTNPNTDKSTYRYNAPTNFADMPEIVSVEMTDTLSDSTTIVASDSISFIGVRTVIDGYTVTPSSGTHNFAATDLGAIDDISSFSTTFTVKRGGTDLTFDTTGSPAANTFKYGTFGSVTPANSVQPQVTIADPDIIVINNSTGSFLTGTTVTQASFVVPIIENDTSTTIANIKIVLSKSLEGVNARTVSLSAPEQAIAYDSNGATPDPSAAFDITATPFNTTGTPKYQFFKGATSVQASSTSAVYQYTAPSAYTTLPEVITVKLREDNNNAVLATDTFTIFGVKDAVDGVNGVTARAVDLSATQQAFNYDSSGTKVGTPTSTVTATARNTSGTVYYEFFIDGTAQGSGPTTSNELTYTPQTSHTNMPQTLKVEIREGSVSGSILATDIIEMFGVKAATNGVDGDDAQNQKTVFVFKKDDSDIGFTAGNDATSQTFSSPTTGLEAGWSTTQPTLSSDGDKVYMSQRLFTSDAASPQESSWSTPVIVASRNDGNDGDDGDDAQNQKTVFVFKKDDSDIGFTAGNDATSQTFASPTTGLEAGWSTTQPTLSSDGDEVYMSQRLFTSDAASPQESSWSTPVIVASRNDGNDGDDAYTVIVSNPTHVFTSGNDGAVDTYNNSGTDIRVFKGTTELNSVTGTPTSGQFKVTLAASDITASTSIDVTNSHYEIGSHSGLANSSNTASITYTINAENTNTFTTTQTFSKSKEGDAAQNQKTVFVFKKDDSDIGFTAGNDATSQTFASPTTGLEAGWSTTQPALSSDGDEVYMSQRLFTSDAASPQESSWSTPVIVASRNDGSDGDDGDDAQNQKTVFVFKKNDEGIGFTAGNDATSQTFSSPTTGLEAGWSTTQPALSSNGDKVYMSQRLFTSDAASPQESSWSTPVIVARRTDGVNAISVGYSNQAHTVPVSTSGTPTFTGSGGVLSVFDGTTELSLKSNTQSSTAPILADVGTYNVDIVKSSGTTLTEPAITGAGSAGATLGAFSGSALTSVTVYSLNIYIRALDGTAHTRQIDITITPADQGATGPDGLRTVHGNLYYEKDTAGAPTAPTEKTYTFATGDIDGGTGANEVLSLADATAVNKWTNEPRTQNASSGNGFYILPYFGTEAAASSANLEVTYGTIKKHTSFTGVVTFSSGDFSQDGSTISNIDGGNVQVGNTALTETNTLNEYTTSTDVGLGNVNNPASATTPIGSGDVASHIGGVGITKIEGGNIVAESTIQVGLTTGTNKAGLTGTSAAGTLEGQADTDVRIYSGSTFANRVNAPFSVTQEGKINAEYGTVGGFSIGIDSLVSSGRQPSITLGSDLATNPEKQITLSARSGDEFLLYAGVPVPADGSPVTQSDNPPFSVGEDGNVVMRSFELRDAANSKVLDSDNLLGPALLSQIDSHLNAGGPSITFVQPTPDNITKLVLTKAQNIQIDYEISSGNPYASGVDTQTNALNSIMPQVVVQVQYRAAGNTTWINFDSPTTFAGVKSAGTQPSLTSTQYWINAESYFSRPSEGSYKGLIELGYGCITEYGKFKGTSQVSNLGAGTWEFRIAESNVTVSNRTHTPSGAYVVDNGFGNYPGSTSTAAVKIRSREFTISSFAGGGFTEGKAYSVDTNVSPIEVSEGVTFDDVLKLGGGTLEGNLFLQDSELQLLTSGQAGAIGRLRTYSSTAGRYGFTAENPNNIVITNEQGSINQAMLLLDTSGSSDKDLWGISVGTSIGDPSTGQETNWTRRAWLTGLGQLNALSFKTSGNATIGTYLYGGSSGLGNSTPERLVFGTNYIQFHTGSIARMQITDSEIQSINAKFTGTGAIGYVDVNVNSNTDNNQTVAYTLPTGTKPVAVVVESPNQGSGPDGNGGGFDMARIINIRQNFCVIDRYNEEGGTIAITLRVYYSKT